MFAKLSATLPRKRLALSTDRTSSRSSAATGEAYLPEQVYGVLETQLAYLRSIGAVGPPADDEHDTR